MLVSLSSLDTVDEFESFVRPHHHPVLTEFCRSLTSIHQADVDAAETFAAVLAKHQRWLDSHGMSEKNALLVTCGDWDLGVMLPAQCPVAVPPVESLRPIYTRWQNVKRAFCSARDRRKAPGMAGMLKDLGLPLVGQHHRGIDDCRNITELFKVLLRRGATAQLTTELPLSRYPAITIALRLDDRVERAKLDLRSVRTLRRLAGALYDTPGLVE